MIIPVITKIHRLDTGLQVREFNNALKAALLVVAKYWHEHFLARHFEPTAYGRYHYQRRTFKYERRKQKAKGHRLPLVWSGETRRMTMASRDYRSTSKQGKVILHGPKQLAIRNVLQGHPDKAKEIKTITNPERKELVKVLDAEMTKHLKADSGAVNAQGGHRRAA